MGLTGPVEIGTKITELNHWLNTTKQKVYHYKILGEIPGTIITLVNSKSKHLPNLYYLTTNRKLKWGWYNKQCFIVIGR